MTATTILPSREAAVHWLADTAERVARTFVQAFLAVFVPALFVPGSTVHWDTLEKAAASAGAAGAAAALAFVMALAAKWAGSPADASFLKPNAIDVQSTLVGEPLTATLQSVPPAAGVTVNVYHGAPGGPVVDQEVPEPPDAVVPATRRGKGQRGSILGSLVYVLVVLVVIALIVVVLRAIF